MDIRSQIQEMHKLADRINRPVRLMEVCGTHTMAAFRSGLRSLFPSNVTLLSGPGCPVCVTPNEYIDTAIAIARTPGTIVTTFGDMVRVPGSDDSLEIARAQGADVRIVYSPLEALAAAQKEPQRTVVFLGVGFETTIPAVAWTIAEAQKKNIANYTVLSAHKVIPPAMDVLCRSGDIGVDGFMCPGHVSVIIGAKAYNPLAEQYHIPCVVTGFEPGDMIQGVTMLLGQIADKRSNVEIQYARSVTMNGNKKAQTAITDIFEPCDTGWRGIGVIAHSGCAIRQSFEQQDAAVRFKNVPVPPSREHPGCRCGDIIRGVATPQQCPLFAKKCTPDTPAGACMVSSEGTCAAWYKYSRRSTAKVPA